MKFGCTGPFQDIEKIRKAGFNYIEFSALEMVELSEKERLRERKHLKKNNFTSECFNDFCDERLPLIGNEVNFNAIAEHTRKVCQVAKEFGVTCIGVGGPKARILSSDFSKERAQQQLLTILFEMGKIAAQYECYILWEALSNCDIDQTLIEANSTVEIVDHSHVKLVADFYHMYKNNENLSDFDFICHNVKHVHFSGENKEQRSFIYKKTKWTDYYKKVVRILKANQYNGTITIEKKVEECLQEHYSQERLILENLFSSFVQ